MTISICIPTYQRPEMLRASLASVLSQTLLPSEILIGDDSKDDRTERLVARFTDSSVPIRYIRHRPSLGQALNVNSLFQAAQGEKILLLHDDDLLLSTAIEHLVRGFESEANIIAVYGKQQLIDNDGVIDLPASESLNRFYGRTPEAEGMQASSLRSALTQQFPNDGFLVDAQAARSAGYRTDVGDACDYVFGVDLARTGGVFCFVNEFTTYYRFSDSSVTRGRASDEAYHAFKLVVDQYAHLFEGDTLVNRWLRERSATAIYEAAQFNYLKDGFRWYFGPYHRHRIATLGGIRRLLNLAASAITRRVRLYQ